MSDTEDNARQVEQMSDAVDNAKHNDRISADGIRRCLDESYRDIEIVCFDEIDSTNNEAKRRLADSGYKGRMLLVADSQTGGRGRLGRSFFSPKGSGIYMTLVYHVDGGVKDAMHFTMAAAVAEHRAIKRLTGAECGIKWVNDLYLGDKKISGILTEAVTESDTGLSENIVVGIGINVRASAVPKELEAIVGSLDDYDVRRDELIATVINELLAIYDAFPDTGFMEYYIEHSIVKGRRVKYYNPDEREGIVQGVDRDGCLMVKSDSKIERIFSGMVVFL